MPKNNRSAHANPLAPHLERFAHAVAEGNSHTTAAEICGRKRGSASFLYSQPGVKERIRELLELATGKTENPFKEPPLIQNREFTLRRTDIVRGLLREARSGNSAGARVKAWTVLADIFQMRARNIKDVSDFYGWTDDEISYFATTGDIPERIRHFADRSKVPGHPIDPKTGQLVDYGPELMRKKIAAASGEKSECDYAGQINSEGTTGASF